MSEPVILQITTNSTCSRLKIGRERFIREEDKRDRVKGKKVKYHRNFLICGIRFKHSCYIHMCVCLYIYIPKHMYT